jgi:hypothetical protein
MSIENGKAVRGLFESATADEFRRIIYLISCMIRV